MTDVVKDVDTQDLSELLKVETSANLVQETEPTSTIADTIAFGDASFFDVSNDDEPLEDTMFLVDSPTSEENLPKEVDATSSLDLKRTMHLEGRTLGQLAASLPPESQSSIENTVSPLQKPVQKKVSGEGLPRVTMKTSEKASSLSLSDTGSQRKASVVSLREIFCRDDTWKTTPHGVCWVGQEGEFHLTRGNGSSTSFVGNQAVFWSCDPWGQIVIQDLNDTFIRLWMDGTNEEIGRCVCNEWKLGLRGIHIRQNNDWFSLLDYTTGEISVTGILPKVRSWEVTPCGLCLQYDDAFYLRKKSGSLQKIGERVCDAWRAGLYGIFLVHGRKFWFISYMGKEHFLGTFAHDEWDVSSDRLYLRYKNVLSVVVVDEKPNVARFFLKRNTRQEIGTLTTREWLPDPNGVIYREGKQFFRIEDPTRDEPVLNWWHPHHHSVCEKEGESLIND